MTHQLSLFPPPEASPAPAAGQQPAPDSELLCYAPGDTLAATIEADAAGFKRRFGQPPAVAWVHPAAAAELGESVAGVAVKPWALKWRGKYTGWFWLGREEG